MGDEAMRAFKFIRDPKAFEVVADETRRKMIYLLRVRDLTVSQIAEELQRTPQAIYNHIRKLLKTGMIEVAREERVDHFIEKYYRCAAEVFEFSYGRERAERYAEQHMAEALHALAQLGLSVKTDKEGISRLVGVLRRIDTIGARPDLEETIAQLEGVSFLGKQEIAKYTKFLFMTDRQFQEWLDLNQTFRQLLNSTASRPSGALPGRKKLAKKRLRR
jgi:DNA-binding transcriptional ArsR family regulator